MGSISLENVSEQKVAMTMLLLDGGQGHSAEKETGSSKEVTLVAQVIPAVQPGAKDG